jgi:predicted DNA-binding protein (UPF0251 family)
VIELSAEEFEALTLSDAKGISQTNTATEMNTSQSTFQRILASARAKVARAIAYGAAIKIDHPMTSKEHTD